MDALHYTRQQIRQARSEAQKEAKAQYQSQMKALLLTATPNSDINAAKETQSSALKSIKMIPSSTRKSEWMQMLIAGDDDPGAAKPTAGGTEKAGSDSGVDLNDLSWNDKERVLRVLFAQMNGLSLTPSSPVLNNEDEGEDKEEDGDDQDDHESVVNIPPQSTFAASSSALSSVDMQAIKSQVMTAPRTPLRPKSRSMVSEAPKQQNQQQSLLGLELTGLSIMN